jgi:DNA (cytosine-5)-methyltransferase 1
MNGTIRYFSMFTGVGGFELGIGDKAECIGFSEIDKYACELLKKRFPDTPNFGDCTKINPTELPDFDMLCGGFPCQSFSIAGKRRGFEDTRGTMFFEVARILEVKRPKLVFLENVKGLLNHNKGETFSVIIQTLEELGYRTQWMVLNSKFFGVPQNRERVFIIGSLRGECRPEILPFRYNGTKSNDEDSQVCQCHSARYYKGGNGTHVGCAYRTRTYAGQGGKIEMRGDNIANQLTSVQKDSMVIQNHWPRSGNPQQGGTGTLYSDESVFCLDSTPHNVIMGMKIRRLTPLECERLQGFPDNWTAGFSDTQRYKMMGNAVTVNVIKAIAGRLR